MEIIEVYTSDGSPWSLYTMGHVDKAEFLGLVIERFPCARIGLIQDDIQHSHYRRWWARIGQEGEKRWTRVVRREPTSSLGVAKVTELEF